MISKCWESSFETRGRPSAIGLWLQPTYLISNWTQKGSLVSSPRDSCRTTLRMPRPPVDFKNWKGLANLGPTLNQNRQQLGRNSFSPVGRACKGLTRASVAGQRLTCPVTRRPSERALEPPRAIPARAFDQLPTLDAMPCPLASEVNSLSCSEPLEASRYPSQTEQVPDRAQRGVRPLPLWNGHHALIRRSHVRGHPQAVRERPHRASSLR